eukprot:scaffold35680_cov38-Phaeocystis_antarctica.AAC.1
MGGLRSIESSLRKRVVASSCCCGSVHKARLRRVSSRVRPAWDEQPGQGPSSRVRDPVCSARPGCEPSVAAYLLTAAARRPPVGSRASP